MIDRNETAEAERISEQLMGYTPRGGQAVGSPNFAANRGIGRPKT
jgi:hypothetical protein